jgi:RNA polymerase sigma-70 factor (ECF subfamily)
MTSLSDDDLTVLLVRSLQDDPHSEKASRQLYERYVRRLHLFFFRRGVSTPEAEDLTQDVFIRVFRGIGGFRYEYEGSLTKWIYQIAQNVYRNRVRSAHTQKRLATELPLEQDDGQSAPGVRPADLVDDEPDPLAQLAEREREEALRAAIAGLSPQRRRCCILRYIHRLKYREIASVMSVSIETVKAHLHQARGRIVEAIQGAGRSSSGL